MEPPHQKLAAHRSCRLEPRKGRKHYAKNTSSGINDATTILTCTASDEALVKLFYLALRNISQKWSMPIRDWKAALTRFTIEFGDRISIN